MSLKFSIVTPSFNQAQFLEQTIRSVLDQNYDSLEYIIIDGGSTDDSVSIIKKYEHHLAYWESAKDRGQVHAINKGLARTTGDVFGFINSDDLYLPGAFQGVADHFREHPSCDWLCGATILFGQGFKSELLPLRVPKSAAQCLSWAYKAPQPGHFWKRHLVEKGFDEAWPYDFDHDLHVRLLLAGETCEALPLPVAAYRLHAISKTVAEGSRQDAEFDRSAAHYESRLRGSDRRWCRGTRFLRESYAASVAGRKGEAAQWLLRSLVTYPEHLASRRFWGTLRRLTSDRPALEK